MLSAIKTNSLRALTEEFLHKSSAPPKKSLLSEPLGSYIDQTLLKPDSTEDQIVSLCQDARLYNFKAVCIQPHYIPLAKKLLDGSNTMPITVAGFPLGANSTLAKIFEAKDSVKNGAQEIDMVINIGALKSKHYDFVFEEIKNLTEAITPVPLKVIVETSFLSKEEKIFLCAAILLAQANFIKTSTGFSSSGAQPEDIKLFKTILEDRVKIKASGGIKSLAHLKEFVEAGANRIGTSSGVEILKNQTSLKDY